jgi:hypothetical protein
MTTNSIYTNKIAASDIATPSYVADCLSSYATCDSVANVVTTSNILCDRIEAIEFKTRTPDVDPATKTELVVNNGNIYVKHYKDGFFKSERKLMPNITDVRVYDNTVVMMFADKTKTSAVLDSEDTFSIEHGISICVTKKLLGEDGNSLYNKLITRALKVIKKKQKDEDDAKNKKEADKKARELKKARAERRKEKKRRSLLTLRLRLSREH